MKKNREHFLMVDFRTMGGIARWAPMMTKIHEAANPGRGRRIRARPFSLVVRLGHGRGTFYSVAGSFARLGNAARRQAALPPGVASWICLAPGFSLAPTRAQVA